MTIKSFIISVQKMFDAFKGNKCAYCLFVQ